MSVPERRTFLRFAAGALLAASFPARTEAGKGVRTVGVLMGMANDRDAKLRTDAFEEGLQREGWTVGENLQLAYRYAAGDAELALRFADELVSLNCDCILGQSTPIVAALQTATRSIPIVFVAVTDPIGSGFVASLARPGGNITGFTIMQATITGKYLSMLKELTPQLTRVAIIYNPETAPGAGSFFLTPFVEAAKEFGVEPIIAKVHNPAEIEGAIAALDAVPGTGLIVMPDNFTTFYRARFISLAAQFRIPTIYPYRYFAEEGGLLSYGADAVDMFRRSSDYVSRILRGASPAELPVQAPTKFELVVNLKTAKAMGLVVPRILLAGADAIIE